MKDEENERPHDERKKICGICGRIIKIFFWFLGLCRAVF